MIARVVVDVSLDRVFEYDIPDALSAEVRVGTRVLVPFGRRDVLGTVVALANHSAVEARKPVIAVTDKEPFLSPEMLALVEWMAAYYMAPVEAAVRTVLPVAVRRPGAGFRTRLFVRPLPVEIPDSLPEKQAVAARHVFDKGGCFLQEAAEALGMTAAPFRGLEKKGLVQIEPAKSERVPGQKRMLIRTEPLALSDAQREALDTIVSDGDSGDAQGVVLLHGVTGSGKTEVYLQAIARVLERGGGAIVLVPEISLTPQTIDRFVGRFGDVVSVMHSRLSDGERHDEWHRIRSGRAQIVVGVRSAVFAPVQNLALIIVDEEHEPSYKQEEAPRYNARDIAVMRGVLHKCRVVLGSATPSMESWVNVQKGKYRISHLPDRVDGKRMPFVRIVDMRLETEVQKKVSVFSRALLEAIRERLEQSEQVILFLNRRGYARALICPQCGYTSECPQCSVSCTYHRVDETLRCHICGRSEQAPTKCPACGDPAFKFAGIGTQRLETIVRTCFPHARVERMDADTAARKGAYERVFGDFRAGKTQILIGTQMIAKGLHFPNVTLVGVVFADMSLHMPDFRAGERTFQLITQVAGRAGRGHTPGEVIVQTYTPFHPAVQAARHADVENFFDQEAEFRRELRYPPFAHLVCILFRGASENKVSYCAEALVQALKKRADTGFSVSGAVPAPLAKAKGKFRYHVMLRGPSTRKMVAALREVFGLLRYPKEISYSVDVDPINLM